MSILEEMLGEVDSSRPVREQGTDAAQDMVDKISEAEKRIRVATYYMQLTKQSVFGDGSEEGAIIDEEIRQFARERMASLLNIDSDKPAPEAAFTDQEVVILKSVAAKVLSTSMGRDLGVAAPRMAKIAAPKLATPKQQIAPKGVTLKQSAAQPHPKQSGEVTLNEVFQEDGKLFKFVESPSGGDPVKIQVKKKSQVGQPGGPKKFPSKAEMTAISQEQSSATASAIRGGLTASGVTENT